MRLWLQALKHTSAACQVSFKILQNHGCWAMKIPQTLNSLLFQKSNVLHSPKALWTTAAARDAVHPSLFAVSEGGVRSAVPPALEKPFSVFGELALMPLSRRDIYSPLDFLPGRLEPDESSRLHWGISARSERWKRGRDVGAGRNVEEFQSSPFKRP